MVNYELNELSNENKSKIYIAGHNGMIGSAILRIFRKNKNYKLLFEDKKLDLTNQQDVFKFLKRKT